MNKINRISILVIALLAFSQLATAQPTPPGSPADVPIDGGLGLLLAAGAAFGGKKAWKARKDAKAKV